jgi:deoxyadenosine/deoxycytidine kinase
LETLGQQTQLLGIHGSGGNVSPQGNKIFVAVAGNIGTGKTTLTRMLSERFGWQAHFESVSDNPYLSDFYSDMARWSFPLQIFFLNHRFQSHKKISLGSSSSIQDRSIYEDANIFARYHYEKGIMQERDYRNYLNIYESIVQFLQPPDLIIYLRKSLPRLQSQIQMRGRDYEMNIPADYLSDLNRYYDDWVNGYQQGKKVLIESDHLDFVNNPKDFDYITHRIMNALDQRDLFLESKAFY